MLRIMCHGQKLIRMLKRSIALFSDVFSVGFAWVGTRRLLPYVGILVPVALVVNAIGTPFSLQFNLLTPEEWRLGAGVALLSALVPQAFMRGY